MGKMRLVWSPVQLRLANRLKVFPIGRLTEVFVEVGLWTYSYFDVIDIINDTNLCLALLGIDWDIENQTIINFKKRILKFEDAELWVVSPIDTLEG